MIFCRYLTYLSLDQLILGNIVNNQVAWLFWLFKFTDYITKQPILLSAMQKNTYLSRELKISVLCGFGQHGRNFCHSSSRPSRLAGMLPIWELIPICRPSSIGTHGDCSQKVVIKYAALFTSPITDARWNDPPGTAISATSTLIGSEMLL